MTETAAIYCRTSMEEPDSLDRQEAACRAWCAEHGLEVAEVFREVGSGLTPLGERPEGGRLLEAVRRGEVGRVVVYSLDRLGRALGAIEEVLNAGAGVVSVRDGFDSRTAAGRLMLTMLRAFAEFEAEMLAQRIEARREVTPEV